MHIQEFYRKCISAGEQGKLFAALRNLCHVEDAKALFGGDAASIRIDWAQWPDGRAVAAEG